MSHDHFCTPRPVADLLWRFFDGPVALDSASNEHSIIKCERMYVRGSLHLPWDKTTWTNPPFSGIGPFVVKGIRELALRNVFEWLLLVPANTSTLWWRQATGVEPVVLRKSPATFCNPKKPKVIFSKRLAFIDPRNKTSAKKDSARFDTALLYYGPRRKHFVETFKPIASWIP